MLMPAVNYLRVDDCEHDAVKKNADYRIGYRSSKRKLIKPSYIPMYYNKRPKINSISTYVTLRVHSALEWQQRIRHTILLQEINK